MKQKTIHYTSNEACIVSAATQPTVSKKQNWRFLQIVAPSLQCPLRISLRSGTGYVKRVKQWERVRELNLTQKEGKLHSVVNLCGCVSSGTWLALCALWIRCWEGADSGWKWYTIFGAKSGHSSVLVNHSLRVLRAVNVLPFLFKWSQWNRGDSVFGTC